MSSEDTTGRIPEMLAKPIYSAIDWPHRYVTRGENEYAIAWQTRAVMKVMEDWLAGRVVVDLPEPVAGTEQSWASPAGRIGLCMPKNPDTHRPLVAVGNQWVLTEAEAEQLAIALLAAVRLAAAERLSGEVRNGQ